MAIYLSISMVDDVVDILAEAYGENALCAVVYRASQPEEKVIVTQLKNLIEKVKAEKITKTALIIIGKVLDIDKEKGSPASKLYQKDFQHGYRK